MLNIDELENTGHISAPAGRLALAMPSGRLFAMEPNAVMAAQAMLQGVSLSEMEDMRVKAEARRNSEVSSGDRRYKIIDGTAVVPVIGTMTKRPHCLAELFGGQASTLEAEAMLRQAQNDPDAKDISMYIETPGGEVSGAFDLANTVYAVDKKKPVYAYMADQATSAGYLVGSQARRVFGNDNLLSGSIGVYTQLADTSEMYKNMGVKVHLVKAGKFKGIGADGMPVSDDDISTIQGRIDSLHKLFIKAVKRGRKMSDEELAKISDAQVFVGAQAIAVGLVDEIASFEAALDMARSKTGRIRNSTRKVISMPTGTKADDNIEGNGEAEETTDTSIVETLLASANDNNDAAIAAVTGTTPAVTTTPIAAELPAMPTNAQLLAFATSVGITNATEANISDVIKERIELGGRYDSTVRAAANKMSIAAGLGDNSKFIAGLPFDSALAHLKSTEELAKSKGLVGNGERASVPVDAKGVPVEKPAGQAGATAGDTTSGPRTVIEQVDDSKAELRQSGIYSF